MVVTVTADVDKGGTGTTASDSGHIFQIGLASAANVTGATFTGNFPLTSAQFTIASVSNLATIIVSGVQNASTSVNAGQLDDLVGQMTVQAGNNPVKVTALNFTNVGSVQSNYLQNIKLMDGSTQLGATISSLGSNNIATFDLSGAPLMLTSGQSAVLSLYADITGGVNRSFQFSIQQSSDVQAVDTTYGVGIGASVQSGGFPIDFSNVTINNGGVVASKDASSPITYAVAGNTNQVLAKFDVLASGDSIKFTELDFLTTGGNTINNFRVVDDQGAQIGTTVNTTGGYVQEGSGSLNYIVPANTTRVLTVYGDLGSSASGTVQVQFGGNHTAAQSYTTYANAPVSAINGNSLRILNANTNLLVNENYALGSPVSAPAGAQNVKIGSYTLTAGQVNGINLTGVTILASSSLGTANWLTNLYVMDGSTQIGQTYAQVTGGNGYSFNSNSPIAIPANGSVTLDVYANISSNSTVRTDATETTLSSINASTQNGQAVTASPTPGQAVNFTTGGALKGSLSAGTSQASYLGMGIAGVNVAQYQFVADNNGSETVTSLVVLDSSTTAGNGVATNNPSDLINYRLTDSSGNQLSTASEVGGTLTFNLTGLVVPSNGTQYVNLMADTNSYPYAVSGDTHAYALQSYNYTNASQSISTSTTSNFMGNLFTVYQTTLGVTGTAFLNPNSISGVNNIVGEFNFTAGSGNMNPIVKVITLSTGGSLISSSTTQTLGLYDSSAPSVLLASATSTGTATSTFTMTGNNWTIPYSSSRTLLVETLATPGNLVSQTNNGGSYQVLLKGVTWNDGTGAIVNSLSPSISIPVASQNITNLSN
jgi:hypothetical protein